MSIRRRFLDRALSAAASLALAAAATFAVRPPAPLGAQVADLAVTRGTVRPFGIGERLTYRVRVSRVKAGGEAVMWVEGPVAVRGTSTFLLRFDFKARLGPVTASDRTWSWIDPERMAVQRFAKHERNPVSSRDETVEFLADDRHWQAADGVKGVSPTDAPLDELSFMYFLRTIPLAADTVYRFERHFDPQRNPTLVRVLARRTLVTEAGEFRTVQVEMRVHDTRRYRGEGVIRIDFTDDDRRIPVRIESVMPVVGTAVMTLASQSGTRMADTVADGRLPAAAGSAPSRLH